MNFFNIIKKGTTKQLESLKSSAIYDIAAEKLEPKTYASQAKPLFLLSKYFSVAYHFISYFIALIGIILFALQLDSFLQRVIIISLSFLFLGIIEIAKGNASTIVFSSVARKEQSNRLFLIILLVTTIFSFVTSVWSAKESIYYASTNTKFSNIDTLQNSQTDSINSLFSTQIGSLESSIKASQNTLNSTKTNWKINLAQTSLKESQTLLANVLEKKENALLSIRNSKTSSYQTTAEKGKNMAMFAAVLFALFEVLNLVCYWFVFQYYQSCLLESNLPNESQREQSKESKTHDVTSAVIPNPFATNLSPTMERKIGFQFGNNSNRNECQKQPTQSTNEQKQDLGKGNKICKNCNKAYTYKIHNQKYCSSECRIDFWQKDKGKKIIFKK